MMLKNLILMSALAASALAQSDRTLPVAYEVDVVVAGGGCGGVAAAAAAAKAGAKVFVVAPHNYLGEDIAGTFQLWLEPGETPATDLARAVFTDTFAANAASLPYSYKADQPTQKKHLDTVPPSLLCRKDEVKDPQHQSIEFASDVTITADLSSVEAVRAVELVSFNRAGDFQVGAVKLEISSDRKTWKSVGSFPCKNSGPVVSLSMPVKESFRYARVLVQKAKGAQRMLLGSLVFVSEKPKELDAKASLVVRPLHVKTTLEKALAAAKAEYLYGCYPTELLIDDAGKPAGLVMANRLGRQAVRAKVVIDATENGVLARLAGVKFSEFSTGKQTARWVTIAGEAKAASGKVRELPLPVNVFDMKGQRVKKQKVAWYEYSLPLDLPDNSWAARARVEDRVRELAFNPSQLYSGDIPLLIPPQSIKAVRQGPAEWPGAGQMPVEVCRPANVERLWVLSSCADVPRACAEKMLRPAALMELGERLGTAAAAEAKALPKPANVKVATPPIAGPSYAGEVKEMLGGFRPLANLPTIPEPSHPLPVLGNFDVVVVGGGTAGAAAGIGAARQGGRTLIVEYLHGLGGVGTLGMIGKYWYGNVIGFAASVPQNPIEERMEFYRRELRKAGGEVWFGVIGCGTLVEGTKVKGIVVATPYGRGAVTAGTVIDATGNAELAAAAGAETAFVDENFVVQASHVPPREVGASYMNGNRKAVDVADPLDVRDVLSKWEGSAFDRGQLVDSRERRHIVGDYTLDWLDQINLRTFPDSVVLAQSDYDSHGAQVHPYFMLKPSRVPDDYRHLFHSAIPYRCILPRGLDNLLVVGLGLSAHRDALPIVRMQPDLQNLGYAAGVAATMAAKTKTPPRQVDVKALQQQLVKIGNVPPSVLKDKDSFPLSDAAVAKAVKGVPNRYEGLEVLLASPDRALPQLRSAYTAAPQSQKLAYAQVLGVMGDAFGADTLLAEARQQLQQKELKFQKEEDGMDHLTQLMWALGNCGDRRAVPVLCLLAEKTMGRWEHARPLVVSLGSYGDPAAAPVLLKVLQANAGTENTTELMAACALLRCGDPEGAARQTLQRFALGPNGPFAQLATQALKAKSKTAK